MAGETLEQHDELILSAFEEARNRLSVGKVDPTEPFAAYRGRPNDFAAEILGERLWEAQRCINSSLVENGKVTVRSCRSSGKTRDIATLVLYFMSCYVCKVITVGASWENVRDQMWAEIRELHASSRIPLAGSPLTTEWRLGPKHFAKGFAAKKEERAQGYHAGRLVPEDPDAAISDEELDELYALSAAGEAGELIVWIIDEAVGVEQRVIAPIIGSLAPNSYLALFANPSQDPDADHTFARSHQDGSGYVRIKIASAPADDPVSCDHEFTEVPRWLLAPGTIKEWKREWGEHSPMWYSHGLALFYGEGVDGQLITLPLLVAAEVRQPKTIQGPWMGVDIASTRDNCVASLWVDGVKVGEKEWRPRQDDPSKLMTVAQTIVSLSAEWGRALRNRAGWDGSPIPGKRISVDKTGLGEGVAARLIQMGYHVNPVDFSRKMRKDWPELTGGLLFLNRRAELHWIYRRALEEGIARLPRRWRESWREAQWPRFEYTSRGGDTVVKIERKEEIIRRHGHSPDHLDSDILAWARPDRTRPRVAKLRYTSGRKRQRAPS